MRATIHQPDFMPWFGFFNKIAKVDTWILLDHVKNNPRDSAFWGRRVGVLVNSQPTWLSITLRRPRISGVIGIPICEMSINLDERKSLERSLRMIQIAYAKAPNYSRHIPLIEEYFMASESSLVVRNMRFIRAVMALLDVRTTIVESSSLGIETGGTRLLVDLLRAINASTYLCGGGASGYQEDEMFAANTICLEYNRFEHPVYPQLRSKHFVPGLSIIDALFNVSTDQLSEWVHGA
ncbi:MAG: hypothetical protein B7X83_00125 [Polynucleobacter sp. 17-46-58]|nr:MAG: hypothetical protein B7X83_00125 [Polynucleobacter sp. 17-46-58]OZB49690.1 MAG: hypothetical protein B7X60_00220 [Polynucleobacter sp. 39-45-136]